MSGVPSAESDATPRCPETHNGAPCQKRMTRMSDGTWLHGGGHWFMSDDLTACMDAGHFDPSNVLAMTPLVHLDVPCPRRVLPPAMTRAESDPHATNGRASTAQTADGDSA